MLKKATVVVAAAGAVALAGSPAFASTTAEAAAPAANVVSMAAVPVPDQPSFGDAFNQFVIGGAAAGYGVASLVAGAYTGIALTPALVAHSFSYYVG